MIKCQGLIRDNLIDDPGTFWFFDKNDMRQSKETSKDISSFYKHYGFIAEI